MRLPTWSLAVLSLPSTKSMADERETEPPGWVAWRARTPVDQSKSEKEKGKKGRDSDELRKGKEIKRKQKD